MAELRQQDTKSDVDALITRASEHHEHASEISSTQ